MRIMILCRRGLELANRALHDLTPKELLGQRTSENVRLR